MTFVTKAVPQDQQLLKHVRSSPFREVDAPEPVNQAAIVGCSECGRRFLSEKFLSRHIAEGHSEAAVSTAGLFTPTYGKASSPYHIAGRFILGRISAGENTFTTQQIADDTGVSKNAVSRAFLILVDHGYLHKVGESKPAIWRTQYE